MSLCDTRHKHEKLPFLSDAQLDQPVHRNLITEQQKGIPCSQNYSSFSTTDTIMLILWSESTV